MCNIWIQFLLCLGFESASGSADPQNRDKAGRGGGSPVAECALEGAL